MSLVNLKNIENGTTLECAVCVVGSGAAGITAALELANDGFDVLLLEAGDRKWNLKSQDFYKGDIANPKTHAALEEYRHRVFGGTSTVWGGRCIPFDNLDFEERDFVPFSGWPISLKELEPYYRRANKWFQTGEYNWNVRTGLSDDAQKKAMIPGLPDGEVITTVLERWSFPIDFGLEYRSMLEKSDFVRLITGASCNRIFLNKDGDHASRISVKRDCDSEFFISAKFFILAMGALEVTRLLLTSNTGNPDGIGNHSGHLGRFYMSHISGIVARVDLDVDPDKITFGYEKDSEGVYCRRRIWIAEDVQKRDAMLNFCASFSAPPIDDPSHRDPLLSIVFFAKFIRAIQQRIPFSRNLPTGKAKRTIYFEHLRNVLLGIPSLLFSIPVLSYKRFFQKRKLPAIIRKSRNGKYMLHYHVEQSPVYDSRVQLSDKKDAHGQRRLHIDYRVADLDVESIIQGHRVIDNHLRSHGIGKLSYTSNDIKTDIHNQIGVGGHHIGTTRMSALPENGVVDPECCVHGVDNLFIASSSVFPTSGHANPTMTIVAIAIRIAKTVKRKLLKQEGLANPT